MDLTRFRDGSCGLLPADRIEGRKHLRRGRSAPLSLAENHRMHDPPGQQREQPGDHQSAAEDADHDVAMATDMVVMAADDGDRQQNEHQDRQQVDRAPGAEQPELVDPKRTGRPRSSRWSGAAAFPWGRRTGRSPAPAQPSPRRHERVSRERHRARPIGSWAGLTEGPRVRSTIEVQDGLEETSNVNIINITMGQSGDCPVRTRTCLRVCQSMQPFVTALHES
jgi:hypothetical protein